jgi:3-phenylpropionate/trans-cinnamate dioxygenase ferredoxin subunit
MSDWHAVAKVSEIDDPGKVLVEVDQQLVALFHAGGQFYALDDVCTHDGGELVSGVLDGNEIACARHGAKFDIRTGQHVSMPATSPTRVHEVKLEGDDVYVRINES